MENKKTKKKSKKKPGNDRVQAFRDCIRPIVTLLLASSFVFSVMGCLVVLLKVMWCTNTFDLKVIIALIAILGNPFNMILTYHFLKSGIRDSVKKLTEISPQ